MSTSSTSAELAQFSEHPTLLRDVRADMHDSRTFVEVDAQSVKFEIIRKARIDLVFMVASWNESDVSHGLELAETAYGDVVPAVPLFSSCRTQH